ncbi:hypothetical protein ACIBVL_02440 [Streptomyces sp. NPDC049687]|uniref:hypothetical protein n=1 Tax=Streptomyces sp. NPDC049687 TaxID=3365596 RepID=UPI0037BC36BA
MGGHSYDAWIALPRPADAAAAHPAPGAGLLEGETGGAVVDPDRLRLQEAAAGFPSGRPVTGPRPASAALRSSHVRALLLVAANSRTLPLRSASPGWGDSRHVHGGGRGGEGAGDAVETVVLPDVSPHSLPHAAPSDLGRRLIAFLGG